MQRRQDVPDRNRANGKLFPHGTRVHSFCLQHTPASCNIPFSTPPLPLSHCPDMHMHERQNREAISFTYLSLCPCWPRGGQTQTTGIRESEILIWKKFKGNQLRNLNLYESRSIMMSALIGVKKYLNFVDFQYMKLGGKEGVVLVRKKYNIFVISAGPLTKNWKRDDSCISWLHIYGFFPAPSPSLHSIQFERGARRSRAILLLMVPILLKTESNLLLWLLQSSSLTFFSRRGSFKRIFKKSLASEL